MSDLVNPVWPTTTIRASSYLKGRIGWQGLRAEEFLDYGPYLITGTDFQNGSINWSSCYHVTEARFQEGAYIHVRDGDLLITKDGTIGKVAYITNCPEKAVLNSGVFLLRCADRSYNHRFLYHLLRSSVFDEFLRLNLAGSTINHLYQNVFERFSFPTPGPEIQEGIAAVLDTIDGQIAQTETLIAKYQQIKAGLMHDLFTRGVTPDGKLRPTRAEAPQLYQESTLGWIPKEWEVKTSSDICISVIDCKNRTPPITSEGHPVIRTPNVRDGEFVWTDLNYTDKKSYLVWTARGKPQTGDIVITREAPVGEVCMISDDLHAPCLGQRLMLYRPDQEHVHPLFMLYALQSQRVRKYLDIISGGSTVGHVKVGDIRSLRLPCPKLAEQKVIVFALAAATSQLRSAVLSASKLRLQKHGLMHDLLTGRVRVKVTESEAA